MHALADAGEERESHAPPDQLTANEYTPGVGLSPHVDSHACFHGPIYIVSLEGHTVIEFRKGRAEDPQRPLQRKPLLMPPRSLLIMCGEARLGWLVREHSAMS